MINRETMKIPLQLPRKHPNFITHIVRHRKHGNHTVLNDYTNRENDTHYSKVLSKQKVDTLLNDIHPMIQYYNLYKE